jgi:hypothetical protein
MIPTSFMIFNLSIPSAIRSWSVSAGGSGFTSRENQLWISASIARAYGASPTDTNTRYGVRRSYTKPSTCIGLEFGGFAAAAVIS